MEYGTRIRELRKASSLTAKELASALDVAPSFVSAIEHNSTKLSLKTLRKICSILNVSLAEFFNDDFTPLEAKIISHIRELDVKKQEALLALLKD